MYIYLLAWRYLRTRFIAVASIVSVTLGVATLIVVNAVMNGFVTEMHDRLHGILSDVEVAAVGMDEIHHVQQRIDEIREVAGDDLVALTTIVRVPALMGFNVNGREMQHQVVLIGIDDKTFGQVNDFHPYLLNSLNQESVSFQLREDGHDPAIGPAGWSYRKEQAAIEKRWQEALRANRREHAVDRTRPMPLVTATQSTLDASPSVAVRQGLPKLPTSVPLIPAEGIDETTNASSVAMLERPPTFSSTSAYQAKIADEDLFDKARDQYTGIIIGKAIAHRVFPATEDNEKREFFLLRPGDDVQITLPTAGNKLNAIMENCTVVDFYCSNMHDYDNMFAFMPLSTLQNIRGMVDPYRGDASVSSIQLKLKPGTDLDAFRDKLIAFFPPTMPYVVQTWQDTQRPLLNAVNLELTILNLLLFMIIAVAGFGILATFFMIVVEKTKDIGILKSLGAPSRGVMAIFLGYGLSLGTVGTGVGILLGLLIVRNINGIADVIQRITGQVVFDPSIYYFSEIPTIVSASMVAWVAAGAIAIAVMASVLPSLRAARMHPVEALRYE